MNKFLRVYCWIANHKWKILKYSRSKHIALVNLHSLAGCEAKCLRCGAYWNDLPNDGITDLIANWSEPIEVG